MAGVTIRPEEAGDEVRIRELTETAFATAPHADGQEQEIVDRLRAAGDLSLSLVAVDGEAIVGHAAFSPAAIGGSGEGWFALGPISVEPSRQRRGIGSALVREGLARLRAGGARGCVLVGDPAYYARFGFVGDCGLAFGGIDRRYVHRRYVHRRYVQGLSFGGSVPAGTLRFAPAFGLD